MGEEPVGTRPIGLDPLVSVPAAVSGEDANATLRLRKQPKVSSGITGLDTLHDKVESNGDDGKDKEEVTWGKTADGTGAFRFFQLGPLLTRPVALWLTA